MAWQRGAQRLSFELNAAALKPCAAVTSRIASREGTALRAAQAAEERVRAAAAGQLSPPIPLRQKEMPVPRRQPLPPP
eukprot:6194406-Pleurochrysis_carterae.AAC.3